MKTQYSDVVAEYLREVDLRLAGLPVLQRRELLADLAAHIATERAERHLQSEAELIEVLERLGSPEVVARAAYEEAGALPPIAAPPLPPSPPMAASRPPRDRAPWVLPIVGAGLVAMLVAMALCAGLFFFARSAGSPAEPMPAVPEATFAPPAPSPSITG